MASVWDTLNKMKARQKALEQNTKSQKQYEQSRKEVVSMFEKQVTEAVAKGQSDGAAFLRDLKHTFDTDESARVVVTTHRERMKKDPRAELQAVTKLTEQTTTDLRIASGSLRKANDIAHRMDKQL